MCKILKLAELIQLGFFKENFYSHFNMLEKSNGVLPTSGFLNSGAPDQLEEMAGYYLLPDQDGLLEQFFSLSTQLFENCGIHRQEEN